MRSARFAPSVSPRSRMEPDNPLAMPVKSVIFDYGGVLCMLPPDEKIAELAELASLPVDEFLKWFWHHRLAYDRGDLDDHLYWKSIGVSSGAGEYLPEQVASFVKKDC